MNSKIFRPDINGLRAYAVISVVLYHLGVPGISGGFTGVDVFFVISGFLMTAIVVERVDGKSLCDFYLARFLRIVPTLAAVTLVLLITGFFAFSTNEYELLARNTLASLLFLSNHYYALHSGYFDPSSEFNVLLHTWSLSVEWQFYLAYPPIVVVVKWLKLPVGPVLALLFGVSLGVALLRFGGTKEALFYLLPGRAWEMLAGGLVYVFAARWQLPDWMRYTNVFGLVLVIASAVWLQSSTHWPGALTLIPVLGAMLVLLANNQRSLLTCNRPLQWVGKISYSVYLWHWPVIVLLKYYQIEFNAMTIALAFLISFILGDISYRWIENVLRRRNRWLPALLLWLLALAVSIGVAWTKGASLRFNGDVKQVAEYRMDKSQWRPDSCFLDTRQGPDAFARCGDKMTSHSLVVWGDSHAAHLMPGIKAVLGHQVEAVQRTAGLCGPFPDVKIDPNRQCEQINNAVFAEITEHKPQTVLLAGLWNRYPIRDRLTTLIERLHAAGVKKVILVGPFPYWQDTAINYIEKYGNAGFGHLPTSFLNQALNIPGNDTYLASLAARYPFVTYISPFKELCRNGACLSVVHYGGKASPVQFDNAHLSVEGARWMVERNRAAFDQ